MNPNTSCPWCRAAERQAWVLRRAQSAVVAEAERIAREAAEVES